MPPLTRWFIKTAFVYFAAALATGAVLAARGVADLPPLISALTPVYFHLFMVGWVTQMIFGVAYWMFPVLSRQVPRGSERLGWLVYGLLNAGLVLRVVTEPWMAVSPSALPGWGLVAAAAAQWLAGLGFVANSWGRVKER
jgi:hypothetical protein